MEGSHVHGTDGFLPLLKAGSFVLPSYFLISSLAFIAALLFLVRRTKTLRLPRNRSLDVALVLMTTGFVGSRLLHVLFEEPAYYLEDFSRVFEIWRGGFVWYGGAVFGAACSIGFLKWKREPIARYCDLFAPVAALGYSIGRVACWFTGCCFGDVCIVPGDNPYETIAFRYPTQIFAIVYELVALAALLKIERTRDDSVWFSRYGQIFLTWLVLHGIGRILMELFRGDPRGSFIVGFSISTWISALLVTLAVLGLWRRRDLRLKSS
jgi:phosphatidylglycerol---prolipoprotein diacylglyceryl transferase